MDLLDQIAVAASSQAGPAPAAPAPDSPADLSGGAVSGGAASGAAASGATATGEPGTVDSDPAVRRGRGVAETARAAIDAMRRGVVAYTTLAD
jgi:hypothetical protein